MKSHYARSYMTLSAGVSDECLIRRNGGQAISLECCPVGDALIRHMG